MQPLSQMDRFADGIRVWSDFQAAHLPRLRTETAGTPVFDDEVAGFGVLFIEPRRHPATEFVLRNLRHCVPEARITVVHGTENEHWMRDILKTIRGRFRLVNCKVADLPNRAYNTLFTLDKFWAEIKDERVLIAQTDTALLKPCAAELLELSTQWSFVGAPWALHCQACSAAIADGCGHMIDQSTLVTLAPQLVGNGGLSIRSIPVIKKVLAKWRLGSPPEPALLKAWGAKPSIAAPLSGTSNEDVFYCKAIALADDCGHVCPRVVAQHFAVEQLGPAEWPRAGPPALGVHKPWVYLPSPFVKSILATAAF